MGKGDRRSKRGKIWRGTTGVRHPKKVKVTGEKKPSGPGDKNQK